MDWEKREREREREREGGGKLIENSIVYFNAEVLKIWHARSYSRQLKIFLFSPPNDDASDDPPRMPWPPILISSKTNQSCFELPAWVNWSSSHPFWVHCLKKRFSSTDLICVDTNKLPIRFLYFIFQKLILVVVSKVSSWKMEWNVKKSIHLLTGLL